jgi:hypothetical protein
MTAEVASAEKVSDMAWSQLFHCVVESGSDATTGLSFSVLQIDAVRALLIRVQGELDDEREALDEWRR